MPSSPSTIDLTRLPEDFEVRLDKSDFPLIAASGGFAWLIKEAWRHYTATDAPDVPTQQAGLMRLIADAKLHDVGELRVVLDPRVSVEAPPGATVFEVERTPTSVQYRIVFAWNKFAPKTGGG